MKFFRENLKTFFRSGPPLFFTSCSLNPIKPAPQSINPSVLAIILTVLFVGGSFAWVGYHQYKLQRFRKNLSPGARVEVRLPGCDPEIASVVSKSDDNTIIVRLLDNLKEIETTIFRIYSL